MKKVIYLIIFLVSIATIFSSISQSGEKTIINVLEKSSLEDEANLDEKVAVEETVLKNTINNDSGAVYKVLRVVDGDTIEVLYNGVPDKVRYIGINTPEAVTPNKPVECFGKEASQKNKGLVLNQNVRLEKDVSERDKYGRLLRYVYVGDTFINLELVRTGYAEIATYPPDVKNTKLFLEAQKMARDEEVGLWGECGEAVSY